MELSAATFWWVAAGVAVAAELATGTFYLLMLALGLAAAAIAAHLGLGGSLQITVGAPYFNKINVPIGLFLLFLTGVGPLFAWRKTSLPSLKRNFTIPTIVGLVTSTGSNFAAGSRHDSSKPCRYSRRQPNNTFAFSSCLRATAATDAPGIKASSTIRRFSAFVRIRRRGIVLSSPTIACPHVSS